VDRGEAEEVADHTDGERIRSGTQRAQRARSDAEKRREEKRRMKSICSNSALLVAL
jgi:hypothetical protein